MPIDSGIALGIKQPEYANPLTQYANVLAIQGAQNQNALAQYGLAKAKREDADQNALRTSLSGVDISTPEGQAAARNALLRSGKVKEAAEFDKSLLERRKITGDIDAKALETGVKALGLYREQLSNVTDPESAARWVAAQYSDPNLAPIVSRMGPMDQAIAKIPRDPKGFQTWLAQNALGMDKFLEKNAPILSTKDVGGTVEDRTFRPLTGELSSLGTTAKTATPGDLLTDRRTRDEGAANRGVTVRGQNMTDARARQQVELGKWQRDEKNGVLVNMQTGETKPIVQAGVPINQPADQRSVQSAQSKAQTISSKVDEALANTGFWTTGLTGKAISKIAGTPAYDLEKTIDTVKANIGFQELQAMRDASPTGGALGQVAVKELDFLQATIANLEHGQSEAQIKSNLKKVKTHFDNWKKAVEKSYQQKYGSVPSGGATGGWKVEVEKP